MVVVAETILPADGDVGHDILDGDYDGANGCE